MVIALNWKQREREIERETPEGFIRTLENTIHSKGEKNNTFQYTEVLTDVHGAVGSLPPLKKERLKTRWWVKKLK